MRYIFTKNKVIVIFLFVLIIFGGCKNNSIDDIETEIDSSEHKLPTEEPLFPRAGPCDNILYPIVLDNQWIYQFQDEDGQLNYSDLGLTVSEVVDSSAVLAALNYDTGIVTESKIECRDGAILNFPMTELQFLFEEVDGNLQFSYGSGLFMPSEYDFETSIWKNRWDSEYFASGEIIGTYDNITATVSFSESPVSMEWSIKETGLSLQVPAGSFNNVIKIERIITLDISSLEATVEGQEIELSTTLVINTNMWFAPHIGLLKQEIDSATIELYGINFPIESKGKIELKSSNLVN